MPRKKGTYVAHQGTLLEALAKPVIIKPYHHKPYRVRHLGLLLFSITLLFVATLYVGQAIGQRHVQYQQKPADTTSSYKSPLTTIKSSYGFSIVFDSEQFSAAATVLNDQGTVSKADATVLPKNTTLNSVTLSPVVRAVPASVASSRLVMQIDPSTTRLSQLKSQSANAGLSTNELALKAFPAESAASFTVLAISSTDDTLANVPVHKTVYQYTPQVYGGTTYATVWSGVINGHAFVLRLQGLIGSGAIPGVYNGIFDSLSLSSLQKVQGLSIFSGPKVFAGALPKIDPKYHTDLVTPSVVKIYRLYCGDLVVDNLDLSGYTCDGVTGSGFMFTSDGYIGTNGHVVDVSAKEIFVQQLVKDQAFFTSYLKHKGMTAVQITTAFNDPQALASVITKIFDESDTNISLKNFKDATFVSLGDEPVKIDSAKDIDTVIDQSPPNGVKKAKIIAENYAPSDLYTVSLGSEAGFTASDVAIIKIDVSNTPALTVNTDTVTQNQKITVIGFPGDADNSLVSDDSLSVTVTDGSVSSIREVAGGNGKVYQSDADASHGNSGGPVVDDKGQVIGILTYRFKDSDTENAAKSYIRDISDLTKLADSKGIKTNMPSSTQDAWENGLEYISTNHFSKALKEFNKVKTAYPDHRLVDQYIATAQKAIADGKDVKDFPLAVALIAVVVAVGGIATMVLVIAVHHSKHLVYKLAGSGLEPVAQETAEPVASVPVPAERAASVVAEQMPHTVTPPADPDPDTPPKLDS